MLPFLGFIITMGSCYQAIVSIPVRRIHSLVCQRPECAVYIKFTLVLKYLDSLIVLEPDQLFCYHTLFSAYILNAEIPLFSLKIKSLILG
jgi:CDP-diacylglycerol--serine O-phosphatidyltransferase